MAEWIFHDQEPDNRRRVTRAEIETCQSIHQLEEWWQDFDDLKMRLKTQVEARILTETDDDDWLIRVADMIGFASRGKHYCEKRLKQLDAPIVAEDTDRLKVRIRQLEAQGENDRRFKVRAKQLLSLETYIKIETSAKVAEAA